MTEFHELLPIDATTAVRLRPGGPIDFERYGDQARRLRSQAIARTFHALSSGLRRPVLRALGVPAAFRAEHA